jgi:hypothetical protein
MVVDNAKSDASADAVAAVDPEVRLIRSDENMGFARSNNLAAQAAKGDLLPLLNPDTVCLTAQSTDWWPSPSPAGGTDLGRHIVFGDGSINPSNCWRRMDVWSLFCRIAGLTSRMLAYRVAMLVRPADRFAGQHATWSEIW